MKGSSFLPPLGPCVDYAHLAKAIWGHYANPPSGTENPFEQKTYEEWGKLEAWLQLNAPKHPFNLNLVKGDIIITPDDVTIGPAVRKGTYEPFETNLVCSRLRPGDTFIDVGSCIGSYTIPAGRIVGPTGIVYAVEPRTVNMEVLKANVQLNELQNVVFCPWAASNFNGASYLKLSEDNWGDHSLYSRGMGKAFVETSLVHKLDSLPCEKADFIKIDTQGAEIDVLNGAINLLENSPRVELLVEYCPQELKEQGKEALTLPKLLISLGFSLHVFCPVGYEKVPGGMEINIKEDYQTVKVNIDYLQEKVGLGKETDFVNLWCKR